MVRADRTMAAKGRNSGFATLQGVRQIFDVWRRKATKDEPIEKWEEDRKRQVLEEIAPVVELANELRRSLGMEVKI